MTQLFHNISELRTVSAAGTINNGALVADNDGVIVWVGAIDELPDEVAASVDKKVDLGGRAVLPGWVDSHTHMIFDGNRAAEFEARMAGESYSAGGIATTMEATRVVRPRSKPRPAMGSTPNPRPWPLRSPVGEWTT